MTYAKVAGLANTKTMKINGVHTGIVYGSILICTNYGVLDLVTANGQSSVSIKHFGSDSSVTCSYDASEETLTVTFPNSYTHGFAIVGGTLAGSNTSISIS